MGCDIHLYVEKKVGDNWEAVKGDSPYDEEGLSDWLYRGRNYGLFAILADVRNNNENIFISEPKGIPKDLSNEVKKRYSDWDGCAHSSSYYTFKDIQDFDWNCNLFKLDGFVSENTYKEYKKTGSVISSCGGIYGPRIKIVLNSEMDRIIQNKYSFETYEYYTSIVWHEKYLDIAKEFLNNLDEYIKKENIEDLENHRIVFWFDN